MRSSLRTLAEIPRETASLVWNVGPYLLRILLPGYDPHQGLDNPYRLTSSRIAMLTGTITSIVAKNSRTGWLRPSWGSGS